MPGTNPKSVNKILSQKAPRMPTVKNTPSGGKMIANMILRILIDLVFKFYLVLLKHNIGIYLALIIIY
jgi:hypothetical protein